MGEQISDQEMSFVSSELHHNESVVDNEIDDRDLLLVKSQPELSFSEAYCKWHWDGKNKTRTETYQENTNKGKPGWKRQLPLFAEFVMVLFRLRLGLLQKQISDIFCISQPSVSKIFTTWITLLYHVFKQVLVRWPSKNLPKCFSKYPRTRVIIDCTETKVEKPSAPSSQKVTWSDYKSHNTFKLLVGITPSGVSFISDLYSGAISDRAITTKSGLLEQLEPMDDVMADRGFNLSDLISKKKATLNIPSFAKGKQLSTKAWTRTRRIAFLRIHVERAIQRMNKFRLLQVVIPVRQYSGSG
ncbi:uncharacterized protein [Montipora capricornis]|uniref:uncharacterized protein n=1 Tax=Montipora capricornis TaxID=246305 RepID=UPI0035F1469A